MRHRRGAFSNERKFHGNDRRESRNDYGERGRFRDYHLYRDREPGYSLYENRYNHEPRYSERSTAFDHVNRSPRERTDNTEKFTSTEESGAAFKEYLTKKYNGTPVSADKTNKVDSGVNNRNAAQSLNNQNIVNRVHDNGVGNCTIQNYQTILENRTQREPIRIFVPRSGSVRNDRFHDQALLNHGRIPSPRQRTTHHDYPDGTSFRYQGGDPYQKTNLDWNRKESTNYWDLRQNPDQLRTLGINATADPLKYNGLYDEPQRQTDLLKHNLWNQPVGKLENKPVFKNSKIMPSLEFHGAQDQVLISRPDSAKSRPCEPVTVSSTYIRNTPYSNVGMIPTRSEQLGMYPYPDNHTVFAQGGEPITRREILPSHNHPRPMGPPTFLKHNYERAGVVIGPEICSDVRTSWLPPPVPVYTTPSHRPDDKFRPVHLSEAIDSLSHGNKGPRILYTQQSTETISVAQPRDGILQPTRYDSGTKIPLPRGQAGIIPDVTMIPLPPPPPPPSPPNYSQQQPSQRIPSVPIATIPCTQSAAVTESQKPSSSGTSDNQVSSTSADLEQISSTSDEQDHSEEIKSHGADEQKLLDETKPLGACDKAKEKLQDVRKEKASEEKNKNRLASARDITDFQMSSSEEKKYKGHHSDDHSTMESINNTTVKSLNQSGKGLPLSNAYYTEKIDSDNVIRKHDFKYGDENKVRNRTEKLGRINTHSREIKNRQISETFETVEDTRSAHGNNGIQCQTAKYNLDQQYQQQEVPSFYNQGWVGHEGTDKQFTRNIKEPFRKDPPVHRPWQIDDRNDRRGRMFNSEFNYNIRDRDYTSFEASYRQRPYARPSNERRRLSGLGIHTYPSHLDNPGRHFSNLGYFRPWEKHRSRWDRIKDNGSQNIEDRSADFQHVAPFFRSDLFADQTGERFWHDDFRVTRDETEKQFNSTEGSKWKNNKDLKNVVEKAVVDCSLNTSGSCQQDRKTSEKELNQECVNEVFLDRQQNVKVTESSDKVVKEKRSLAEHIDCRKEIESSAQEAKTSHSKTLDKIPPGCTNDSFAKKRQDRYNRGHSYSEIVAVKSRNDQDKKVKEDVCLGKSKVHMSVKDLNAEEANKNNCELKGVQRLDKKSLFGSSKDSKSLYPPSTIAMPILSILGSAISKVNSKRKLSKIAKPDISLENTLLKSEQKHSHTKLGSYKIPLLKRNKEESKKIKDNLQLKIMSVEKKVDNSHASKEQKSEPGTSNKLKSKSIHKDKRKCETQKGKNETEKAERKRKQRVKSDKERHTAIDLKSLHPKLRHKIAPSSVDSEEKELRIVVEKCKIEHKSVDKSEVTSSFENKYIRRNAPDKNIENQVEILKQKPSSLMRGKFVLSTPNTYVVKETKKAKLKEKTLDNSNSRNSVSVAKESLDKALFSAKKYLLYRALAVNALTRDKTKPLVEKKSGKRKSFITTDMAKQELEYLEETLDTNLEKCEVDKDENNNEKKDENNNEKKDENNNEKKDENSNDISNNEKREGIYENPIVKLDLPTTEYKPQRTAIGNYAAQCLFGPIVSSTYYKAPGKARVIRNSKETFAGYTKCPEDFGVNDAAMINSDMNKTIGNGREGIVNTVNTSEPATLIDVVTVNCSVSPRRSVALTENLGLNNSHLDTLTKVTNKEGICEIQQVEDHVNVSPSEAVIPDSEFETCNKQIVNSTCDDPDKAVETDKCESEQQAWLPPTLLDQFSQSPSNIFSTSEQLEMHKKYLQAKQEITASCQSYAELKSNPIPVLPSLLPTFPVTTLTASVFGNSQQFPVCSSSSVHGPNTVGLNPAHASMTKHKLSESSVVETETVTETEKSSTDATCGSGMQYEPSNEEFEMYRNYQIQRVAAYTNGEGQKSPYCVINDFPKWKGETEKLEDLECPLNNEEFEDDNQWRTEKYDTEGLCLSDETLSEPRTSIRVESDIGGNISGNLYNSLPLEDNNLPDQDSPFQYPEGRDLLQQKGSCDIINIDQELQDTSKNMFEDLVTDILTDTELISSIPINPPDITREVSLTNVSEEFEGTPAPGGNSLQLTSPQIPTLSPKAALNEAQNDSELQLVVIKEEQSNVFKSARAPLHLGTSRKPRFEKRFPKPLPRAKPQKTINAERELYMAAERFLGDFDHSNKRSCCKGSFELLINPVTGKMESVKIAKNEEHAIGQNVIKSENVESLDKNMAASTNCDSSQLDKPCDVNDIQTKTMSVKSKDSNVVTRQQLAMKKLILRSKGQKLRTKSKVVYANKSKYDKGHARGKESEQSKTKQIQEKKVPSIRLKTVKETNGNGKTTIEKWQNVTQKLGTDEKSKNTIEKRQKDSPKLGSDEKSTCKKTVLKERSKTNTEKHQKDSLKTELNIRSKNSTERCQKNSPRYVENKGKIKANEVSKKHKPTSSATSKQTRQVESSSQKDDMGQQMKDILHKQLCKLCKFSCNSFTKLKIHYSRMHVNWCLQCRKQFKDPESCRYHISQSHNAAVWCEVCGSTFRHRPNYDRHLTSMFHKENLKWIEFIKKKGEKKKTVKETVLISDDDGSAVEIIENLSKNGNKKNGTEDSVNEAIGRKIGKTKGAKSPDVNPVTSRKRKHPEFISEDDVDAKKVNSIQYCNVCKQYYKKMRAHLTTKKHEEMVKEWQELKANTSNGEDGLLALTVDDSDHDMSIHIDDDTQEEEDVETIETLSDSSGKSVVIVSDHDCSFEYESDDCKAVITGEDGSAFMKHGYDVQFESLDPSHSLHTLQPEAGRELCLGPDPNNLVQSGESDKTMKEESFDSKMDVVNVDVNEDDRSVPVIVSAWQQQICSPTLLVKNIAADLMCKGDSIDVQQKIFESMSSEQKCCSESVGQCDDNDQEMIEDVDSKGCDTSEVCAIKSCIKEDMDVDSERELEKNIIHEQVLGEIDRGSKETTERVAEVVPYQDEQVEMDRETIKEEPEDIANAIDESNITDYEVIENPCSPEDCDLNVPK